MRIELYAFEYFDPIRKRWLRGRYIATKADIEARYPRHRVIGEPEIRDVPDDPPKRMPYGPAN
jgi:hypothetical protein